MTRKTLRGSLVYIAGFLTLVPQTFAVAPEVSATKSQESAKFDASIGMTHYQTVRTDLDPISVIEASVSRKVGDGTLAMAQSFVKHYVVDEGQEELEATDTRLSYSLPLDDLQVYGFSSSIKGGVTLPVSEFSRRNEVLTKSSLGIGLKRSFLDEDLTLNLSSTGSYQLNRYETTVTETGSGGGEPLPHLGISFAAALGYNVSEQVSVSGSGSYGLVKYQEISVENDRNQTYEDGNYAEPYSVSASISWEFKKSMTLALGYDHSSAVEKTSGMTDYFYIVDDMVSTYFVGFDSAF